MTIRSRSAPPGLSGNDLIACGFARADLVICVGYDMVEYHPERWHRERRSSP